MKTGKGAESKNDTWQAANRRSRLLNNLDSRNDKDFPIRETWEFFNAKSLWKQRRVDYR